MPIFYVAAAALSVHGEMVQRATILQARNQEEAEAVGRVAVADVWPAVAGWLIHQATATQWQQADFDWMTQMLTDESSLLAEQIDSRILSAEIVSDEREPESE